MNLSVYGNIFKYHISYPINNLIIFKIWRWSSLYCWMNFSNLYDKRTLTPIKINLLLKLPRVLLSFSCDRVLHCKCLPCMNKNSPICIERNLMGKCKMRAPAAEDRFCTLLLQSLPRCFQDWENAMRRQRSYLVCYHF